MIVTAQIDQKELNSLVKDLESLQLSDSRTKTTLRQGMRKASKPILQELKDLVPKDSGQLRKSLAVINGKNRKGVPPSVFIGPRVKGAFANMEKTGFYFYFLEYGFRGKPGLRMLDKAASSKGNQAMNSVIDEIKKIIDKKMN
jgi:HK97 gp10 family phage protein|tara:strand:+ start:89 stop:517 length:429 start_codon:yes stop_codon:yes gene_type:complete